MLPVANVNVSASLQQQERLKAQLLNSHVGSETVWYGYGIGMDDWYDKI
jgi:hypothetical protein